MLEIVEAWLFSSEDVLPKKLTLKSLTRMSLEQNLGLVV